MVDYKKRSRNLRQHQTEAEKKIWGYLRNRQINGLKFYRQYAIEPYICDFVCRDLDIVIEIDGGQHNESEYDQKRDAFLSNEGYRVFRYWNNDVIQNIEGVLEDIMNQIEALTPALSLKGEGVLPTSKLERWKYSNLPAYVSDAYEGQPLAIGYDGPSEFVTTDDAEVTPWAAETYGDMQLWEGLQDVLSLVIPEDMHVDKPVNLFVECPENKQYSGSVHVHLKKGARLTIYDDASVEGWLNRMTAITVDEGAELNHIRTGAGNGVVTNLTQIDLAAGAKYNAYALNTYGAFMRDQIHARLNGTAARCDLSGAKILKGKQHSDTTILIEHLAAGCHSNQNYRNILQDNSRGVFQGKVHVHQVAQQTDGYQLCNSILLSEKAEMDTKPELEIYADDVKCSHGATTAQLDEEPIFYLMARGIPQGEARNMLMHAFVSESLEAFDGDEDIYGFLGNLIEGALDA